MKFKLVEKFDETRSVVQDYMYDAMDELNNASLEEYIQWFKSELTCYGDDIEQAVTDAYIESKVRIPLVRCNESLPSYGYRAHANDLELRWREQLLRSDRFRHKAHRGVQESDSWISQ